MRIKDKEKKRLESYDSHPIIQVTTSFAISKGVMIMSTQAGSKYLESKILTASREQLILMLYDGLLRFADAGKRAIIEHEWEDANKNLIRCQDIVLELAYSLDKEQGGEVAENLARLYHYAYKHLVTANIQHQPALIDEVITIFQELREAWSEAMKQVEPTAPLAVSAKAVSASTMDATAPTAVTPARVSTPPAAEATPAMPVFAAATSDTTAEAQPAVARLNRPTTAYTPVGAKVGTKMGTYGSGITNPAKLNPDLAAKQGTTAKPAPASKVLAKIPVAKMAVRADDPNRPRLSVDG